MKIPIEWPVEKVIVLNLAALKFEKMAKQSISSIVRNPVDRALSKYFNSFIVIDDSYTSQYCPIFVRSYNTFEPD